MLLGAEARAETAEFTMDCWKPVLHDTTLTPSNGKFLNEIFSHPHVRLVCIEHPGGEGSFPYITIENIWNEIFEITFVMLPNINMIAAHAIRVDC